MEIQSFFSTDYFAARQKFLEAAKAAGAILETIKNPSRGPGGEALFVDTAWVGPIDARNVFVAVSGTHGAEGLCGSGVQVGTLRGKPAASLPDETAMLMIHAINPYGCAWMRRATEEGVDLCRNFMDFSKPLPVNPLYDELSDAMVPKDWFGKEREQADKKIQECIAKIGLRSFLHQIPVGQYKHPAAPFYGGIEPSWANGIVHQILKKYLMSATKISVIDYHTGLGPYGHGELLCFHRQNTSALKRAQDWWGSSMTSVFSDETVAYALTGGLLEGIEQALPNASVTAAAYEFGTVEPMVVLDAMRADHWLHTYGDLSSPAAAKIRQIMFDTFHGDSDEWRDAVWVQSDRAQTIAIERLAVS